MSVISWTENYGEDNFEGFDMSKLKMDEAYLNVSSTEELFLYSVYKQCIECPFLKETVINQATQTFVLSTRYAKLWRVLKENVPVSPITSNRGVLCELDPNFGEFGVYDLQVTDKCRLEVLKEPVNIYFPIFTVILIYILLAIIGTSCVYVWRVHFRRLDRQTEPQKKEEDEQTKKRLRSLDTFRGICIVLMIFVNFGCGGYAAFNHAIWNGLQLSDLVFPWFMWIMGVCVPISVSSAAKKEVPRAENFKNILRRSVILFGLGLFLGAGKGLPTLRVLGVLQRFAICYLIAASAFVLLPFSSEVSKKRIPLLADISAMKYQWIVAVGLVVFHSLFTFLLFVPDCYRGYLGPGGYHKNGSLFNCTGGAAGYIDKVVLGNHRFQFPTIVEIYKSEPFDPEGILGFLTSAAQVLIGSQAGVTLLIYKNHFDRLTRWITWGVVLSLVGGSLCGFSKEDGLIPLNKNLWSLSFVLVLSGLAFLLLSFCYYIIDMQHYWTGKPFLVAGMNAIFLYVGHNLAFDNFPFRWQPENGFNTHFFTLLENVWATGMWVVVAYYLYTIKFFLSI